MWNCFKQRKQALSFSQGMQLEMAVAVVAPAVVETIPLMPVVTLTMMKRSLWMILTSTEIPLIIVPLAMIITILMTSVLNMLVTSRPWSQTGRRSN
jgi:hypothetical protein